MFDTTWLAIASCGVAGILSTPHCALMCGPIAGVAGCGGGRGLTRYFLGRLVAYMTLGAVAGAMGGSLVGLLSGSWPSAVLSWLLAAVLLVTAYRLWRPKITHASGALVSLGVPDSKSEPAGLFARVSRRLPKDGAIYGLLTGLLPCGALYGAIALSAGAASALGGALAMATFALASAGGLFGARWVFQFLRNTRRQAWVRVGAAFIAVGGVILLVRPIPMLMDASAEPACCDLHAEAPSGTRTETE